jgi:peroxiredoxin
MASRRCWGNRWWYWFLYGGFLGGCRQQLGELQRHLAQFRAAEVTVLALSVDPLALAAGTAVRLEETASR